MQNVKIRRPIIDDYHELNQFFRMVITDTFSREGLAGMVDEIENEIAYKKILLESDYNSNGENRYFLIALYDDKIIGSIEYGPANDLINNLTNGALKRLVEVGTVFVHPNYQRQGIGNLLLNSVYHSLRGRGIEEFCLDSGYNNAQKIWKKKFGEPNYLYKDYWCVGHDHMIWSIKLNK